MVRTLYAEARDDQLDRERQPIQAAADRCHGMCVRRVEAEIVSCRLGTMPEQLDCFVGLQGSKSEDRLTYQAERRAARGDDAQAWAGGQEVPDGCGGFRQQVLAVVEDEQHGALAQEVARSPQPVWGGAVVTKRPRNGVAHQ